MTKQGWQYSFDRRELLKLGSAAVAGMAVSAWPFAGLAATSPALVSAGYAAQEPEGDASVGLVSANALRGSDGEFLRRDARIAIRSSRRAAKESAFIDVIYPAAGFSPDSYPTYRAWSVRQDRTGVHTSAPVSFRVPVDARNGLQLIVTRVEQPGAAPRAGTLQLPLHRGIYVIAHAVDAAPRWRSLALIRDQNGIVLRDAPFSYVVLTVGYAA